MLYDSAKLALVGLAISSVSAVFLSANSIYRYEKCAYNARMELDPEEKLKKPTYWSSLRKVFAEPENPLLT